MPVEAEEKDEVNVYVDEPTFDTLIDRKAKNRRLIERKRKKREEAAQ